MKQSLKVCGIDQRVAGGGRVLIEWRNHVNHLPKFLKDSLLFIIWNCIESLAGGEFPAINCF
jgi:hypothetical protein